MKKLLIGFLLLTSSAWAHPASWDMVPPATVRNQMESNQWAAGEFHKADAELNRVWKELTPKLGRAEKNSLVAAQLKWIEFRDLQAKAEAMAYQGGSHANFIRSVSLTQTTQLRTFQLKQRLKELVDLGN